jgi:hypothetical protein
MLGALIEDFYYSGMALLFLVHILCAVHNLRHAMALLESSFKNLSFLNPD